MEQGQFLFGVNAGGLAYTDLDGNFYAADTFGVGRTFSITTAIESTFDDTLYQSEVWNVGGFTYEIALAPGIYYVELNFAEIWSGTFDPDARVFDVFLEGLLVEDDLDIVAAAGGPLTAYTTGYFISVTDGGLTITTTAEIENPKLSAFSIWSVTEASGSDTVAPTVSITLGSATGANDPLIVTVTFQDETGLDPSTIDAGDLSTTEPGVNIVLQNLVLAPDGLSAIATYSVLRQGGWTSDPVTFRVAGGAIADAAGNQNQLTQEVFTFGDPFAGIIPVDSYGPNANGAVRILVTPNGTVQISTFNSASFSIENLGDKRIAAVLFDIDNALFPDTVFDPLGLAGDSVSRGLLFSSTGGTGAVVVGETSLAPFIGVGGTSGYEAMLVRFDSAVSGGFQTGEKTLFGVDLDANSIVGIPQQPIDINNQDPRLNSWDIGGVSGAEIIGSTITVLFTDGTKASGQLMGDGSQGGAIALVDQSSPALEVDLTVNGVPEGGSGTYGSGESVFITGPAGQTARVVLAIGFAQPFDYVDPNGVPISVADRLALAGDPFGANNALEIQTVNVVLTGAQQNITSLFDFNPPGGILAFAGNDVLPIAFTASVIDLTGQPLGPVTAPIYLANDGPQASDTTPPSANILVGSAANANDPVTVTVTYADETGLDPATIALSDLVISTSGPTVQILSQTLQVAPNGLSATATYSVLPQGGWTGTQVNFSIGAGAISDAAGNPNAAAQQNFTFSAPPSGGADSLADMTQLALQGVGNLVNPTSIDVGADGRLYVSQQNGLIIALTIDRAVTTDPQGVTTETWSVTSREDISLVKNMPNHDDTGIYQSSVVNRQVTGLVTTVDANGNVMLYVTSSDPRIGGGGSGVDLNLDTNSGIISRLMQVDDGTGTGNLIWQKVDLVRGFPRSEENHSLNGLQLSVDAQGNDVLVVTVGGNTNAGAQSNNFAYTSEYYYSGAIITVDLGLLDQLEQTQGLKTYTPPGGATQTYLYDLPTLDDPTRSNVAGGGDRAGNGSTTADVFGGNDGLNQAIFDPTGIVKLLATGFRNQYDVIVTESGAVYTIDNGSNAGWGGPTVNAQGNLLVDTNGDGIADNGLGVNISNEAGLVNNGDALHRVDDNIALANSQIYYAGHPNLYRAYGADAGFYLYASGSNNWGVPAGTPLNIVGGVLAPSTVGSVDLAPLIVNADQLTGTDGNGNPITDEIQALRSAVARVAGITNSANGALYTWVSSTNGIEEYTASGGLDGNLLAVSFDGKIYAVEIGPNGEVVSVESRALTSSPLDVVAQGDSDPYPGVIFVAAYGADQIVILSPDLGQGVLPNPNDRDADGIDDTIDAFAADPDNGLADLINPDGILRWSFVNGESFPNDRPTMFDGTGGLFNGGDIGFTGVMTNRGGLPETLHQQENVIWGGAPGVLQVKSVEAGDATTDTQRNGFQLGVTPGAGLESFTVTSLIDNYLDEIAAIPASEKLSQGIFVGAGDQKNFVSVSLVRVADGRVGFEVISQFAFAFVGEAPPVITFYEVPSLASAGALDTITLGFDIDIATAGVTPTWTYRLGAAATSGSGAAVTLQGDALAALRGTLTLPDDSGGQVPTGFAVGVVSSRSQSSGGATIAAISAGGDESFTTTIDGTSVTFVPDTQAANVTIVGNTKIASWSESLDITNSSLDELYTEERYAGNAANWGYAINTGNGTFAVDLYFAETWPPAFVDGTRVFGVFIEGVEVAANLDIYQTAGAAFTETVISYNALVTDGVLDISFDNLIQNAKVNAVLVRDVAPGILAADWDDIEIRGFGTTPPDTAPPVVAISYTGGAVADDPLLVTVTYQDETGLDPSTISTADLVITTSGPAAIEILSPPTLDFAPDGLTATATYNISPIGGWTTELVTFDVASGAISDASGNPNAAANTTFSFDDIGNFDTFVFAVNAGGAAYTTAAGVTYQADPLGAGKKTFQTTAAIAGTEDDVLYQSEVWQSGGFIYNVAVEDGTYRVELNFAEIWSGASSAGIRVFDVFAEDQLIFNDLDIFDTVGSQTALVLEAFVEVTDGALTLSTSAEAQNPKISAFSIWADDLIV